MAAIERLKKKQQPQVSVALLRMKPAKPMAEPATPEEDMAEDTTETEAEAPEAPKPAAKTESGSTCTCLQDVLNATFSFYLTAHKYHWNVESDDFNQYHDFFGAIYSDAFDAVDDIAEKMRQLGDMAEVKSFESGSETEQEMMVADLEKRNAELVDMLKRGVKIADGDGEPGVSNFLAERVEAHQKWGWKLRASMSED